MVVIIFSILVISGSLCFLFGFRLLSDCAELKADLPNYIRAVEVLAVSAILLTEAYYRSPFKIVWA